METKKNIKKYFNTSLSLFAEGIESPIEIVVYHIQGMPAESAEIQFYFRNNNITHLFNTSELLYYKRMAVTNGQTEQSNKVTYYE